MRTLCTNMACQQQERRLPPAVLLVWSILLRGGSRAPLRRERAGLHPTGTPTIVRPQKRCVL